MVISWLMLHTVLFCCALKNRLLGSALDMVTGRAAAPAQRPQAVSAPPVMVNPPQMHTNPSMDKLTPDKAFRGMTAI